MVNEEVESRLSTSGCKTTSGPNFWMTLVLNLSDSNVNGTGYNLSNQ